MKLVQSIFLVFLLVGLALLEYGCNDNYGGGGPTGRYLVTGAESTLLLPTDSSGYVTSGEVKDSIRFNRFLIRTDFVDEYFAQIVKNSFNAYAEPAYLPTPEFLLDSVKIRNIANSDSTDITHLFSLKTSRYSDYTIQLSNDSLFRREVRYESYDATVTYDYFLSEMPIDTMPLQCEFTYYPEDMEPFKTVASMVVVVN